MRGTALIVLLALAACGRYHSLRYLGATGLTAIAPTPIAPVSIYAGTDAREASADLAGNVWIATAAGARAVTTGGAILSYRAADGLVDDDVRAAAGGRAGSALVGFGTQGVPGQGGNPPQTEFLTIHAGVIRGEPHRFGLTGEIVVTNHAEYDSGRDQYWIGTNEGVSIFTAAGDLVEHRHPVHPHGMTLGVAIAPSGDVWDADQFQLSRLNAGPNADFLASFDPVLQPFETADQLLSSVALDAAGLVYVGSLAYGLARIDLSAWSATIWSAAAGLPSLRVQSVAIDPDGSIWVGTDAGLGRLDPRSGAWQIHRASAGLPSDDIREVTIDRSHSPRRVVITTGDGVVVYAGS
jgi:ligand-binding sensor domain-containing protein